MRNVRPEGGWCWVQDDPEMTYPDPGEWLDDVGYYSAKPMVQRFDWGVPAPSTWLVAAWPRDGDKISEEFASEEEAIAFAQAIEARRAETVKQGSVADESAVAESDAPNSPEIPDSSIVSPHSTESEGE